MTASCSTEAQAHQQYPMMPVSSPYSSTPPSGVTAPECARKLHTCWLGAPGRAAVRRGRGGTRQRRSPHGGPDADARRCKAARHCGGAAAPQRSAAQEAAALTCCGRARERWPGGWSSARSRPTPGTRSCRRSRRSRGPQSCRAPGAPSRPAGRHSGRSACIRAGRDMQEVPALIDLYLIVPCEGGEVACSAQRLM